MHFRSVIHVLVKHIFDFWQNATAAEKQEWLNKHKALAFFERFFFPFVVAW